MVSSRSVTAVVGLVASLLVSAVAWLHFDTALFFLFVPFVPFLFRRHASEDDDGPRPRTCPRCGYQTRDPAHDYCPRDGTELE